MSTVHLQGIGKTSAKAASGLNIGDVIVWNYGSTSKVLDIKSTAKTVFVELSGGFSKKFSASRMVAVQ